MRARIRTESARVLDFDIEAVAAGYGDPQWVPQRVTAIAWSWTDRPTIKVRTRLDGPLAMYEPFLRDLREADMVTGHNLLRYDLPVIQADLIRCHIQSLPELLVQDTMRLVKTKGLKKGQDNLSGLFRGLKKLEMSWQEWEDAYEWDYLIAGGRPTWKKIKQRCRSDVKQHKQMRESLLEEGLLKPPVRWKP